jgi:hypothetical protein
MAPALDDSPIACDIPFLASANPLGATKTETLHEASRFRLFATCLTIRKPLHCKTLAA